MAACFKPTNVKSYSGLKDQISPFIYIQEICIKCNICNDSIFDIINFILKEKCDFSAFGFNIKTQEFWAKKIKKDKIILHFILNIKSSDSKKKEIIITPMVGHEREIIKIIQIINKTIQLYQ